ncbi:unnamed protein product [Phytophthora lilii]|uniref:Unnamed protein product n=1 Tax=Phytophthora lilii TaxID=2077276 RepID=A0A9W6YEA2_9STRA|nr:unnamed protein product [Phytophthora lilii]
MANTGKATSSLQYVDLSLWSFGLWWVLLFAVHLVTCGYNAAYAMAYWQLQDTYLYLCLEYSGIGMPAEKHHKIAIVNAILAAMHGACLLWMVGASLWQRELAFSPFAHSGSDSFRTSRRGSSKKAVDPTADDRYGSRLSSRLSSASERTSQLYSQIWGRQGLLGVNGNKFHVILIARELLETILQTVQAYRMSWYLPRMLLNRFYLTLLVLNCWSSVFIYSLFYRRDEARRRFACLVCDCILDLISCIGVPLIIVLSYINEYDPKLTGFDMEKWYDDVWSAHALNEFQMVVVVSWSDLASRVFFSLGLIFTMTNLKELLRRAPRANKRRIATTANSIRVIDKKTKHEVIGSVLSRIELARDPTHVEVGNSETGFRTRLGRISLHLVHMLFGIWGIAVLALHIQASIQAKSSQCVLQVHPWAVSQPSCYLAVLDCHSLGITGKIDEIETKWSEFDRFSVVTLVMRHCSTLEIPDMLGDFHQTTGIKVYNSTILRWEASAAITNTNHPEMIWFYLVRVNLTNGILPEGAQATDFPGKLYDIEFCYTNLQSLPDDLDSKWLVGTSIYMEYCQLTSVPLVLTRLDPYYLFLSGNPITELPSEIFEVPGMYHLGLGNTSLTELPRNVSNFSPLLSFVQLTNTNISFFWSWIDTLLERSLNSESPLKMGGSTYCADRDKILSGEADSFSVLPSDKYSAMLTNASEANWDVLLQLVDCHLMVSRAFYPIVFEDSISSLKL